MDYLCVKEGIVAEAYKDPVCGMDVTPETAAATFEYEGKTYYFFSPGCKPGFERDPEECLDPGYRAHM